MTRFLAALIALVLVSTALQGQDLRGSQVNPIIHVDSVSWNADTTRVAYRVEVGAGSVEPLWRFIVAAPASGVTVSRPTSSGRWRTHTYFRGFNTASWTSLSVAFAVSDTTPSLQMTAPGYPGVVNSWSHGRFERPTLSESDTIASYPDPASANGSAQRLTVGVVAAPADTSPGGLIARLSSLQTDVCGTLGWLSNSTICSAVSAKISQASTDIGNGDDASAATELAILMTELHTWFTVGDISDHVYWLLEVNAAIIHAMIS